MRKFVTVCILTAFAISTSYGAMIATGNKELGVSGLLDFDTAAGTLVEAEASYGVFVADGLLLGGRGSVSDDDVLTLWTVGAFGEYNHDLGSEWVPFVGLSLDFASGEVDLGPIDEDEEALVFGTQAGVKYFITEAVALAGTGEFRLASEDIFAEDDGVEDTDWRILLGLRFYFE